MATSTIFSSPTSRSCIKIYTHVITLASRQSHDVEEEKLSSEEGTLPCFFSGDRLSGDLGGSQAHLCHRCLYQFKLLNSPNERWKS